MRSYDYRPSQRILLGICVAFLIVIGVPPLVVVRPTAGTFFAELVLAAFALGLVALMRRRVRLSADDARGALAIVDERWPLRTLTTSVALADIAGAEVVRAARSTTVRVEIVLQSGERVAVTGSFWGPGATHERAAAFIRDLAQA